MKFIRGLLSVILLVSAQIFAASDAFNQNTGSSQAIATYSTNWAASLGGFVVPSGNLGQYRSTSSSADNLARWTGTLPSGNQEAIVTVTALWVGNNSYAGPAIGLSSVAADGYAFGVNGTGHDYFVGKFTAGAEVDIPGGTGSLTIAAGDRLKISKTVVSTTVTIKIWRALAASPTTFTQVGGDLTDATSAFTAGTYGIYGYGDVSAGSGAGGPWDGNDLAGAGSSGHSGMLLMGAGRN